MTRMGNVSGREAEYFLLFSIHSHDNKTKVDGTEGQAGRTGITDSNFRSKNYR